MEMQTTNMMIIIISFTLCICLLLSFIFSLLFSSSSSSKTTTNNTKTKLPPGPSTFHLIANFIWHRKPFYELGPLITLMRQKYGPIMTVHVGSSPTIFVADQTLAYQALIQQGAVFADRPDSNLFKKIFPDHYTHASIALSSYGSTWRILRRNLIGTEGVLYPSRLKSYSHIRLRALNNLVAKLKQDGERGQGHVYVKNHFRYAIFSMLVLMCYGDNIEDDKIQVLDAAQDRLNAFLPGVIKVFVILPKFWKIVFRHIWNEFQKIVKNRDDLIISLIRSRKKTRQENEGTNDVESTITYIDTLMELQVGDDKGQTQNLGEVDLLCLTTEFISPGTDTTATTLNWIMANIVKHPRVQEKIIAEMNQVIEQGQERIKEDDLQKLPYIKAVILEGLRRHPPVNVVAVPHTATEDVELGGYLVPKGVPVCFLIPDMGHDPNVWKDPMEFKPERFMFNNDNEIGRENSFDITGRKEITMLPFGAGRRICPGLGLATLNLEYFVANLVWCFEWTAINGENNIDLSEKIGFMMEMKNPLRARISPRLH
ncbi:hypothetical protein ACOSP7_029927 [Xanthoceras sorbifolium]